MNKEHPIIFSAPMIPLILDGTKTQTRRLSEPTWGWRDVLWVREPLRASAAGVVTYTADGCPAWRDGETVAWPWTRGGLAARYCPRWASRITLRAGEIREEKLLSIGIFSGNTIGDNTDVCAEGFDSRAAFLDYFHKLHPGHERNWNPTVWVTRFTLEERKP